jgi:hypothetical protein
MFLRFSTFLIVNVSLDQLVKRNICHLNPKKRKETWVADQNVCYVGDFERA